VCFDKLVRVLASSIGSPCNSSRLSNTFKSVEGLGLNQEAIGFYLGYMQDAFLVEKSMRFDVKGRKCIGSLPKYYFSDIGIRNAVLDFRQQEEFHIMENVIYNGLWARGYNVDVGFVEVRSSTKDSPSTRKQLEVDFASNLESSRYYMQSALGIPDSGKMAQETASLKLISDSFKKVIIVKDNIAPWHNDDGILIIRLFDFLLKPESLDL